MTLQISIPQYQLDREVETVINEFGVDINRTEKLPLIQGQNTSSEFYIVNDGLLPESSYLVVTPDIIEEGADLSIVKTPFLIRNLRTSMETAKLMKYNGDLDGPNTETVILYQLRAALAYKLGEAIRQLIPQGVFHEILIRPKYDIASFKDHQQKVVNLIYEDYTEMPRNKRLNVIVIDSIATAKTPLKSIPRFVDVAVNEYHNTIANMSYVGWISKPGAVAVHKI